MRKQLAKQRRKISVTIALRWRALVFSARAALKEVSKHLSSHYGLDGLHEWFRNLLDAFRTNLHPFFQTSTSGARLHGKGSRRHSGTKEMAFGCKMWTTPRGNWNHSALATSSESLELLELLELFTLTEGEAGGFGLDGKERSKVEIAASVKEDHSIPQSRKV